MPSYMYLFRAPKDALTRYPRSPERARESGERWHAWAEALAKAGHSVTGGQLEPGGTRVTGTEGTVVAGAFGDEHVVGGWFVVEAESLAHATDLAKGCPILQNGGTVEERPVMHQ